jgi:hypothetical protein
MLRDEKFDDVEMKPYMVSWYLFGEENSEFKFEAFFNPKVEILSSINGRKVIQIKIVVPLESQVAYIEMSIQERKIRIIGKMNPEKVIRYFHTDMRRRIEKSSEYEVLKWDFFLSFFDEQICLNLIFLKPSLGSYNLESTSLEILFMNITS